MVGRLGYAHIGRIGRRAASLAVVGMLAAGPLTAAPGVATALAASDSSAVRIGQASASLSEPLRDLQPDAIVPAAHSAPLDMLADLPTHPGQPSAQVTDPIVQSAQTATSAVSTAQNFAGVSNLDGVYPPDTNGAVGPNHYVQWVNLHFAVFTKAGAMLAGFPKAGNALWSGTNTPCATQNAGDPIVLYDRRADRWLFAQFTSSSPYGECIAISQTGDPTGAYYRYFFQFSTNVFYDYPKIGIWSNGYFLTANRFTAFYQGASAIAIDRSAMLAGQTVRWVEFQTSSGYGTLLPADIDGSTMPPAGAGEPIADVRSGYLDIRKLTVDWAASTWSLSAPTSLAVAAFNQLCPSTRSCVPQPGTTIGLDGLGDRLMYRLAYRNLGSYESLVVNHAVNVASSGTHAGVRWYEVRNVSSTPTLYQQGTFAPDGSNRWIGTMAIDASGGIALGYSVSSSSVYPGMRVTGRLAGDVLGQMTQAETTIIAGSGVQTGSGSRWGDYASMSIDPSDDCTFWFTSEFMPTTGPAPWQTRIASFKLPGCGSAPSATPSAPQNLAATGGNAQVSLSWSAPSSSGTSPITSYSVYRGTTAGGESSTPMATVSGTTYTDTSVTNGATYYYTVAATNASGTGPVSNEASAIPATTPSAPQNLTATAGNASVALSWAAPASNGGSAITSYSLYRGTSSGGENAIPVARPTGTTYTDTGLTNGTTYYYTVTATNSAGTGPASNEASATPTAPVGATVPGSPTLSGSPANGKGVQLSWTTPSDGGSAITGYAVYRGSSSGGEALLASVGVVNSYKDTSTSRGVTYFYEVKATNAVGSSGYSNEVSVRAK